MGYFGSTIPVTGLNLGYLGQVSRTGVREIASRQANASNKNAISFGDPVQIVSDATGGTYRQIADGIANFSLLFNPFTNFAGIAVREVKTNLASYPYVPGVLQTGNYQAGEMAEVLERGSICVKINVGTGIGQGLPVYLRVLANAGVSAGVVGGFEAQADVAITTTATASAASTAVTLVSGSGVAIGQYVSGPKGIAPGTYVAGISGTALTLSQATTEAVAAGTPISITWTVPLVSLSGRPILAFRTGVLDANNVAEVTLLDRVSA